MTKVTFVNFKNEAYVIFPFTQTFSKGKYFMFETTYIDKDAEKAKIMQYFLGE